MANLKIFFTLKVVYFRMYKGVILCTSLKFTPLQPTIRYIPIAFPKLVTCIWTQSDVLMAFVSIFFRNKANTVSKATDSDELIAKWFQGSNYVFGLFQAVHCWLVFEKISKCWYFLVFMNFTSYGIAFFFWFWVNGIFAEIFKISWYVYLYNLLLWSSDFFPFA